MQRLEGQGMPQLALPSLQRLRFPGAPAVSLWPLQGSPTSVRNISSCLRKEGMHASSLPKEGMHAMLSACQRGMPCLLPAPQVRVCLVGTGYSRHPDVNANVRLRSAYNAVSGEDPFDARDGPSWQGTVAASLIGAVSNNSLGLAGVAWQVGGRAGRGTGGWESPLLRQRAGLPDRAPCCAMPCCSKLLHAVLCRSMPCHVILC